MIQRLQANTAENEPMLKILLSFGSGGLLGDAFLHLIPHSQSSHHDSHQHSHAHGGSGHSHGPHDMTVGGYVLAGKNLLSPNLFLIGFCSIFCVFIADSNLGIFSWNLEMLIVCIEKITKGTSRTSGVFNL